jgi:hypothetical protein
MGSKQYVSYLTATSSLFEEETAVQGVFSTMERDSAENFSEVALRFYMKQMFRQS